MYTPDILDPYKSADILKSGSSWWGDKGEPSWFEIIVNLIFLYIPIFFLPFVNSDSLINFRHINKYLYFLEILYKIYMFG